MLYYERSKPYPPEEYYRVPASVLREYVTEFFKAFGVPEKDAAIAADVLVTADLFGIESHGVQRLRRYYYTPLKRGVVKPHGNIRVIKEGPTYAIVDGGDGIGLIIGVKAMKLAIKKAKENVVGFVLVRNSSHYGIAGYHAKIASDEGLIGIAMSNSQPLVAYTNTIGRNVGTNPIAVAIPTRDPPPILIDMATSVVPIGKIEVALRLKRRIPLGWGIDRDGNLIEDPEKIFNEGALLPLGGLGEVLGGHKGSCLIILVDVLSGILSGSGWGPYVNSPVSGKVPKVGHFFAAIDVKSIIPIEEFYNRIEEYKRYIKGLKKHPNADNIWIPGEKAWLTMQTRLKIGIPVHKSVIEELGEMSATLGISAVYEKVLESARPIVEVKTK
ncbi:MAG: malate dehydrogenase [Thermoprotei archaeon]|nr:MAG: malate dehydrogenase [Thermoprotei archaeon]RLF18973.1 MAG: malate dehydrogenase [Thermoprotei archaeon]